MMRTYQQQQEEAPEEEAGVGECELDSPTEGVNGDSQEGEAKSGQSGVWPGLNAVLSSKSAPALLVSMMLVGAMLWFSIAGGAGAERFWGSVMNIVTAFVFYTIGRRGG
jgi:hypothetical protein